MADLLPVHESLWRLLGTWEGPERLFASAWTPGGQATGRVTYRAALGGQVVVQDYRQVHADGRVFELHGVLGVDPQTQAIVWYTFDTRVPLPEAPGQGEWYGSTLALEKVTPRGVARHRLTVVGHTLNHTVSTAHPEPQDEDFQPFMDGTYRRISPQAPASGPRPADG